MHTSPEIQTNAVNRLFCLGTSIFAEGLDVASYGKWNDEASVKDDSPEGADPMADGGIAVPVQNSMTDESPNGDNPQAIDPVADGTLAVPAKNVTDEAPVQDGYVPMPARAKSTSDANWWKHPDLELGLLVGGSGSYIPVDEKLLSTLGFPPEHYKFHVSGEGVSTGMNIYAGYRRGDNTFGASLAGYVDTHTLKNYDAKRNLNSGTQTSSMTFLDRSYTLEFAARAGHYFGDLHVYGKLGVLCSAFQYKLRNGATDSKKNLTAWGGSAGIGLQKPFSLPAIGDAKIGLEYAYQIYQTLTPVIRYTGHVDTSKLRPRYHTGFLTIVKPF